MFKQCCGDCGECWYIGNSRTCTCPDKTQKREWVELTDEEIQTAWVLTPQNDKAEGIWFGRRIEAKIKEKNT